MKSASASQKYQYKRLARSNEKLKKVNIIWEEREIIYEYKIKFKL